MIDKNQRGQFIFPREVLLNKGVLRSATSNGKMAMRVYPDWETDLNPTAVKTQRWQSEYFIDLSAEINK